MMLKAAIGIFALFVSAVSSGANELPTPVHGAAIGMPYSIELSKPFSARAGWRFEATQSPQSPGPLGSEDDKLPGVVRICVSPDQGRTCRPGFYELFRIADKQDLFSQPHFLNKARIVHPRADLPLLLIQVASLYSGDGDQLITTTALAYDHANDAFIPVFFKQTGRNHDQEVRYVETGPLRGAIISTEPTEDAPFGFWVTINKLTTDKHYRQVLRYRSSTHYGDGNPLAVIDSEMINVEQRLNLWHPGAPLPLPAVPCPLPRLINHELWCSSKADSPH